MWLQTFKFVSDTIKAADQRRWKAAFVRHRITPGNHGKDRRSKIKTSEMHLGELDYISKYISERSSVIKFMEDFFYKFSVFFS